MATRVQLIGPNGQDKSDTLKLYIGRMNLATCTHPVFFVDSIANVSGEDLTALQGLGVVRVAE